jgi:NADH-quinone oxidoreductase subunit N
VLLFTATVDAGYTWLAVLAVANSVLSLAYYLRVLAPSYFEPLAAPVPVLGRWAKTAAVACAVAVVTLGVLAEGPLDAQRAARLLPG